MTSTIVDAYLSTISVDSFEARVIASNAEPVIFDGSHEERPGISEKGMHYFRFQRKGLTPGKAFTLTVEHGDEKKTLHGTTLTMPGGQRRLRFGILADLHLNARAESGGRRILASANALFEKYLKRMMDMAVEFVILPGDIVDCGAPHEFEAARRIIDKTPVRCYPVVGNHESWHTGSDDIYFETFDVPGRGYRAFSAGGVRFILLHTPEQDALGPESAQLEWLQRELESHSEPALLFAHFALILHPCNQGWKNDGYQLLDNSRGVLRLLKKHDHVCAVITGHKNVPSLVMQDGIAHILCPQLVQAPCAFDIVDVHDGGIIRTVHEIDEQHLLMRSRLAGGEEWWIDRFGENARNFTLPFRTA